MNHPLRRVAFGVLLLLGLLLANLTYLQAFQADKLNNRGGNARVLLEEYDKKRGDILVDGKKVATSVETNDRLTYLRRYPEPELYAHATGYYSSIFGRRAVEQSENAVLTGEDNRLVLRRAVRLFSGSEDRGGSVALTLDPKVQKAATEAFGDKKGAVVAIEPSTGAILAMVSFPSYDPNPLSAHDDTTMRKVWDRLNDDPDKPLLNRAVRETYPPGSTFKLVTAAAALSSGQYEPKTEVPGPAVLKLPETTDATLPNSNNRSCTPGSDTTTLETALRKSCNTSFGAIGLALGGDALRDQAEKFGFGQSFDLAQASAASVFPSDLDLPATAQSAIGQRDVRATPLQMAIVAAGIANRGVVMRPYLVRERLGPDLSRLDRTSPGELSRAVSGQVADQLTDMMVSVVERGTGTNAKISGVRVAGKTGTAQQGTSGKRPHAWFVAFAPADPAQEAKVAVAVIIEDGDDRQEVSGNRLAAPVAKAVMQAVLK